MDRPKWTTHGIKSGPPLQVVEMVATDVPDLTIIDLPGIVRTPVAGQDASVTQVP